MLSQMWNTPKSKAAFVRGKDSVNCLGNNITISIR